MESGRCARASSDNAIVSVLSRLEHYITSPSILREVIEPHVGKGLAFFILIGPVRWIPTCVELVDHINYVLIYGCAQLALERHIEGTVRVKDVEAWEIVTRA